MQIALLTDFGTRDVYVGVMKSVVSGIAPSASVVDLTHEVSPQAVDEGAFLLAQALPYLPSPSVVCAVVDPGVGTERRAVVLATGGRTFVGPDNGLLTPVLDAPDLTAHEIADPSWTLPDPSATFHGRDVFAPVAAHLATGRAPNWVGPPLNPATLVRLEDSPGKVLHVDRFGNLVSDLPAADVAPKSAVRVGDLVVTRGVATFGEAEPGTLVWYPGSFGTIEIAEVNGDAATRTGFGRGTPVEVVAAKAARS